MDIYAYDGMDNSNYVLSYHFTMENFHDVYNSGFADGFEFSLLAFLILFIIIFIVFVTVKIFNKKEE